MKLLGGFLYLPHREAVQFGRALARDARRITDPELELLLSVEWRTRLTAAWLIGWTAEPRDTEILTTRTTPWAHSYTSTPTTQPSTSRRHGSSRIQSKHGRTLCLCHRRHVQQAP
ncbi:DUF6000 family protein [Nonomuraea sp. NPDC055795]